jgi:phosphoenolpyruvate carboxykinase (ATP)
LNTRPKLYIVDGYVGWDPDYRLKCRIVCSRAYHALFMKNMLIRPTLDELAGDFANDDNIDFHVFNGGEMRCPSPIPGIPNDCTVIANFSAKTYTICGT